MVAKRGEEEEKVRMVPALAVRSAPKAAFRVNSQREEEEVVDKEEKGVKVNRQDIVILKGNHEEMLITMSRLRFTYM